MNTSDIEKLDTDKHYCRILYDILLAKGVKDIVLSPGSRNAPLLIGASCRPFNGRIITDERTAAFVALGIALTANRPVALVCTSGTALYNYAPAIAEAYYQHIPLIVITADRPLEWIDQDDSQTLIQPGALDKIVKGSYDIPVENQDRRQEHWYVNRIVNEACNLALSERKGPVHINIRLDNPLNGTIPHSPTQPRIIEHISDVNLPPHIYKKLTGELNGKKVLVTAGFMQPDHDLNRWIRQFAEFPNVAIMSETLSNLHLDGDPYSIDTALSYLENHSTPDVINQLTPDVVISIGGALISRKLKEFLRNNPPAEHWTLGDTSPSSDCFMCLSRHIDVSPAKFFKGISHHMLKMQKGCKTSEYKHVWSDLRTKALKSHDEYIAQAGDWSEMTAFKYMLDNLPSSFNLFLSNGTSVRYGQLFTEKIPHATFGCRGVSGIDGTSATAAGCAMAYPGETILISGDMSMSYDTGVLGLKDIPERFKIVVINNNGGGIFRFIPSTRNCHEREELFCAPPILPLKKLADAYGWKYMKAESMSELKDTYQVFLQTGQKAILEIKADKDYSADVLVNYMKRK